MRWILGRKRKSKDTSSNKREIADHILALINEGNSIQPNDERIWGIHGGSIEGLFEYAKTGYYPGFFNLGNRNTAVQGPKFGRTFFIPFEDRVMSLCQPYKVFSGHNFERNPNVNFYAAKNAYASYTLTNLEQMGINPDKVRSEDLNDPYGMMNKILHGKYRGDMIKAHEIDVKAHGRKGIILYFGKKLFEELDNIVVFTDSMALDHGMLGTSPEYDVAIKIRTPQEKQEAIDGLHALFE